MYGKLFVCRRHRLVSICSDSRAPAEFHARFDGAVNQQLMQLDAPHGKAGCIRKIRARGMLLRPQNEFREMESALSGGREIPSAFERGNALRQDAFSARLVDGRFSRIQYSRLQSLPRGRDRRNDSRGSRSDNENFTMCLHKLRLDAAIDRQS